MLSNREWVSYPIDRLDPELRMNSFVLTFFCPISTAWRVLKSSRPRWRMTLTSNFILQVLGELDLIDKISSQLIGVAAGGFSLQALLNLLMIYLTSIVGVITHELLIVLYGMAFKKRGMVLSCSGVT